MDDFVLVRTDGTPTYNFATVVDDVDMAHHARHPRRRPPLEHAASRSSSTRRSSMPVPVFAHLSMIWGPDGKRLSKRHGATTVEAYAELGYLPEALLNYLALLGWSLDGETTIIDAETLKSSFSLDRISKNPAIFDVEKLEWMNGVYLRELPAEEFVARMVPVARGRRPQSTPRTSRRDPSGSRGSPLSSPSAIKRLDEIVDKVAFLFAEPTIDESAREKVLAKDGAGRALTAAAEALAIVRLDRRVDRGGAARAVPRQLGLKPKVVFQAVRVAVTGSDRLACRCSSRWSCSAARRRSLVYRPQPGSPRSR